MRIWILYAIASVVVAGLYALIRNEEHCSDSDDGRHHDVWCSQDSESGRRTFMQCLHCLRETPGAQAPWLRRRTHPTPGRSRG